MDTPQLKLSLFIQSQERALKVFLQDYSPSENVQKRLDNYSMKINDLAVCYSDSDPTSGTTSFSATSNSTSDSVSVPETPTNNFDNESMFVPDGNFWVSEAVSSSASLMAKPSLDSCAGRFSDYCSDSSSVGDTIAGAVVDLNRPILANVTNSAENQRSPTKPLCKAEKSRTVELGRGIENQAQSSIAKPRARFAGQKRFCRTLNQTVRNPQTIRKRRKASGGKSLDKEIIKFVTVDDHASLLSRSVENVSTEKDWSFVYLEKFGVSKKIQKEVKSKACRARPRSKMTKSDEEERKALLDFNAWVQNEEMRKGGVGSVNPVKTFRSLQKSIAIDGEEDEDSNHTASQVTSMILSIGSVEAVSGLKSIIKNMRHTSQALMVLPTIKQHTMDNLIELAPWFFEEQNNGTELEKFRYRHYIANFCRYVALERDELMEVKNKMTAEEANHETYAKIIVELYPTIPRYQTRGSIADITHQTRASTIETAQFTSKVAVLETKCKSGFRWLELQEEFGVGILALYHYSKKFSKDTCISVDDIDLSGEEFNLLKGYLFSNDGHIHNMWLTVLCNLINDHIEQGSKGMLRLPELLLERSSEDDILSTQEQSWRLAMMCRTFSGTKKRGMDEGEWKGVVARRSRTR